MHDIYCQLVPNDDDKNLCYDMIPRIGAFEVSYKGIILFSKMMSSVWPHFGAVAKYVDQMFNDMRSMSLVELSKKYTTTGKVAVMPRESNVQKQTVAKTNTNASKPAPKDAANEKPAEAQQEPAKVEETPKETAPAKEEAPKAEGGPIKCGSHLKSDADLINKKGCWLEFPEGTKSLLSKHCTKEVF